MTHSADNTAKPVHGCLEPWQSASLPVPPPMGWRNLLKMVGPGIIAMGMGIGAGEWLFGPVATVQYQGRLMCIVWVVIFFQAMLNTEAIRYTLYTGEPVFTGYMRLKPGPKFWAPFFISIDLFTSFWPGFALTAATALLAVFLGPDTTPGLEHQGIVKLIAVGLLLFGASLLLFGGKVYTLFERVMTIKVLFLIGYLLFVGIWMIDAKYWVLLAKGMVSFGAIGEVAAEGKFLVIGAFIAYAGLGGLGNACISNYARDKGWGMGGVVGAIPSAIGGKTFHLSAVGKTFPINQESLKSWRGWWRYVQIDQFCIWAIGSLLGMGLPAIIGLKFLDASKPVNEWGAAVQQAKGIASVGGPAFYYITVFCGFLILFATQLGAIEILPRRWTDLAWTGFPSFRRLSHSTVSRIYYAIIALYVGWCLLIVASGVRSPFMLVVLMANLGLFPIIPTFLLTIIVNRKFLPRELRPPVWREVMLVLGACCYATFFIATTILDQRGVIRLLLIKIGIW